jgi:DNA-binding ferritin-like protein
MSKSNKKINRKRKSTIKNKKKSSKLRTSPNNQIVLTFLEFLNMIKLYHWKTRSYSQHKATDELYGRLNDNIDKFVEVLLGKDQSRIEQIEKHLTLINTAVMTEVKPRVLEFRSFLTDLNTYFDEKRDSDLFSIRDDILVDVNQFLYLLSFDKP